jgi:voltage-gated potassium channel
MAGLSDLTRPLVSRLLNTESTRREIILAGIVLICLMGAGTIGYAVIEEWSFLDGLYMTFITLTTIGFSEVRTLSDEGRLFTIAIGLIGIGAVAFIATRAAQLLVVSEGIRERHMKNQIAQLKDHYIICGYGRIGSRIVQDLRRGGREFVVVEIKPEKIEGLVEQRLLHVGGNAESEDVLRVAGIERAAGLILTLPEDSANVFVTLTARELRPDLFILVRTDTQQNARKLKRAGANKVVAAYEIGADRMAQVVLRPNVDRFVEDVLKTDGFDLSMEEVRVQAGSTLAGRSLSESQFRQRFDAIVVAILDSDNAEMSFNPAAQTVLKPGDILIVLGNREMISRLIREGCTAQS